MIRQADARDNARQVAADAAEIVKFIKAAGQTSVDLEFTTSCPRIKGRNVMARRLAIESDGSLTVVTRTLRLPISEMSCIATYRLMYSLGLRGYMTKRS